MGHDALKLRSTLNISYPIESGLIQNWEDIEVIWAYLFGNKLNEETRGHSVLLAEPPREVPAQRSKITEIMFEKYVVLTSIPQPSTS